MKALILSLLLAASPVAAGELTDLVMAPGLFAALPEGAALHYDHTRHAATPLADAGAVADGLRSEDVTEGAVTLAVTQGRLVLTRQAGEQALPGAEFPLSAPNPVLLFFLENVVRNVAVATGGSPFYIRNRLRAALAEARAQTGAEAGGGNAVVLHPFAADPNAAHLGDFASLALTLRFDPADPARLLELKADTAAGLQGYTEHLLLIPEE